MIDVFLALIIGILIGYFYKLPDRYVIWLHRSNLIVVIALIFFMGISIGLNRSILTNLVSIGGYSLLLAITTLIGSVIAITILSRFTGFNLK